MDFDKVFDDLKGQLGTLAQDELKDLSSDAQKDARGLVDNIRPQLQQWTQQLADTEINEDEFRELVLGLKTSEEMEAWRKASAAQQRLEQFRDSALQLAIKVAIAAIV